MPYQSQSGSSGNVSDTVFKAQHTANPDLHVTSGGGSLMLGAQMIELWVGALPNRARRLQRRPRRRREVHAVIFAARVRRRDGCDWTPRPRARAVQAE